MKTTTSSIFKFLVFCTLALTAVPISINCAAFSLFPVHISIIAASLLLPFLPADDSLPPPSLNDFLPPAPIALFALCSVFSFSMAVSHGGSLNLALRSFIPLFIALVPGSIIFKTAIRRNLLRYCFAGLFTALIVTLAFGCAQYLKPQNIPDAKVGAFFRSAADMGGFLTLALGFVAAGIITLRPVSLKIIVSLLLMLGLLIILDGPSYWGIMLAFLAACSTAVVSALRPERKSNILAVDTTSLRKPGRMSVFCFLIILGATMLWQSTILPFLVRENEAAHFSSMAFFDAGNHKIKPHLAAWQTAACMGLANSATGAGLGQFEVFRDSYSETVPFSEQQSFSGDQNQYLLLLAEGGLPFLLLGMAMLCSPFLRRRAPNAYDKNAALGSNAAEFIQIGSAIGVGGFAFASINHPFITSGEHTALLVFVLVLAIWARPAESPWEEHLGSGNIRL